MKKVLQLMLACGASIVALPAYSQFTPESEVASPDVGIDPAVQEGTEAPVLDDAEVSALEEGEGPEGAEKMAGADAPKASANRLIEEVVVTAQRREEKLQSVPISVQAFSGDKLDAMGVKKAEELPAITPGLVLTNKAGYTVVFLRGVGTDAFLPAADPNVPIYIDGVPQLSSQGASNILGRIARVEVLKGPQGTLFGRNSTGGAISMTTPDPSAEFGGDVGLEFGNYDTFNTFFFLNLPVTNRIGATISGYSNRQDNFYNNVSGPEIATFSRGVRTKIVWDVTDDLTISGSAVYGEQSDPLSLTTELTRPAPVLSLAGILLPKDKTPGRRTVSQDLSSGNDSINHSFSGSIDWNLPWIELKAIGSVQRLDITFGQWDFDSTDRPLVSFIVDDQYQEQKTAEFQILSNDGTPFSEYFSFVAGGFYLTGSGGFPNLLLQVGGANGLGNTVGAILGNPGLFDGFTSSLNSALGRVGLNPITAVSAPLSLVSGGILETDSLSGYFQGTFKLGSIFDLKSRLDLVLGARIDKQTRGLNSARLGVVVTPANPHSFEPSDQTTLFRFSVPDVSATQVPLRVSLAWFPTEAEDIQFYGSFSRGFTSPTYNTVNFFSRPDAVKASRVDNYEIGAKTQLFDNTLTFNTAAFYVEERNLLTAFLSLTSGGIVRFDNAPAARILGAEIDATWQPLPKMNPGLVVAASATYLDSEYTDYPEGRGFDPATGLSFGPGASVLPPRDFTGHDIVNTPTISFNFSVNQAIHFNSGNSLELSADIFHNSGYYNVPQQEKLFSTKAYSIVNAHISYFYTPWNIEITGFVRNLFQEEYTSTRFVSDFGVQDTLNPPRTYGLRLKATF